MKIEEELPEEKAPSNGRKSSRQKFVQKKTLAEENSDDEFTPMSRKYRDEAHLDDTIIEEDDVQVNIHSKKSVFDELKDKNDISIMKFCRKFFV